jgi:hypothetical protein
LPLLKFCLPACTRKAKTIKNVVYLQTEDHNHIPCIEHKVNACHTSIQYSSIQIPVPGAVTSELNRDRILPPSPAGTTTFVFLLVENNCDAFYYDTFRLETGGDEVLLLLLLRTRLALVVIVTEQEVVSAFILVAPHPGN